MNKKNITYEERQENINTFKRMVIENYDEMYEYAILERAKGDIVADRIISAIQIQYCISKPCNKYHFIYSNIELIKILSQYYYSKTEKAI